MDNATLRRQIVEAVQDREVTTTEAWSDLDSLSSNTTVDTVETFPEEIRIEGSTFEGPLLWYVVLHYGPDDADQLISSESFPGHFEGHLNEEASPIIDKMVVDVSGFYE